MGKDLNTAAFNKEPVGTGPHVFEEGRAGEWISMTANPDYFDGPANIERVTFTFVVDENARVISLPNENPVLDDPAVRRALSLAGSERVGLTQDLLQRFPHEVSEGQLQRACLARSLILEPGYLICDELGSMLDVSTRAALLKVVSDEQENRGLGVLLITHDRILAGHWCQEMIELAANKNRSGAL